jgi:hypothetical protein
MFEHSKSQTSFCKYFAIQNLPMKLTKTFYLRYPNLSICRNFISINSYWIPCTCNCEAQQNCDYFKFFIFIADILYHLKQISEVTYHLHDFDYDKILRNTHELVRDFSTQILQQPFLFTAAGFYPINYNLVASVIMFSF